MDKKRTREMARVEWQKEKEAKRRARTLQKQAQEQPQATDQLAPGKEASSETTGSA